ncbi:MAG: hypothetical protein HKP12_03230 [Gammaproteobacteria bacterium]|nr:hypothetical protein [Gammaproteobacteria bacterium]
MIYKLLVNAAFLAIGYYIGKEVCRSEFIRKEMVEPRKSASKSAVEKPVERSEKSNS